MVLFRRFGMLTRQNSHALQPQPPPNFHNLVQALASTSVPVSRTNGDVSTSNRSAELSRLSYLATRWLAITRTRTYVQLYLMYYTSAVRKGAGVLL